MSMRIPIVLLLVSLFLTVCSSNKKISQQTGESHLMQEAYKQVAVKKYKENVVYKHSDNNSYVLCIKKESSDHRNPNGILRFFVYDKLNSKVVLEESIPGGSVNWISQNKIEVKKIPGIVSGREGDNENLSGYIYDVKQQRKQKKPEFDINK